MFSLLYRKPSNTPDYDGETDLLGLVSNIVDEEDSQDSYFSEGYVKVYVFKLLG